MRQFLTALALIIWIIGFFAGIMVSNIEIDLGYHSYSEFSWGTAISIWTGSLLLGLLFAVASYIISDIDECRKNQAFIIKKLIDITHQNDDTANTGSNSEE